MEDSLLNQLKRVRGEFLGKLKPFWRTPFYGYTTEKRLYIKITYTKPYLHDAIREVLEEKFKVQNGFYNYVTPDFLTGFPKVQQEKAHQEEMLLQSAMKFKSFQEKIEELTSAREKDEPLKESLNKELEEKNAQLTEFKIQVSELNEERATLFKTIDELEAVKVKYEVLQESSTGKEKTKIENDYLRKRLEQACEFNEQEVEKRKTIENKLAATEASSAQS
ncbi:Oidioi.mRNA.OKI2018_I69.YSR.g17205.t1.cds [Oikopleura dioica]|uniref:Oidioi.mRNA.OKI2018_I69.YSR.g17205.t1.cds n=1 Tax=Oikopleura dioica TaxID=34765 RepID=A0ABN7SMP6_OIKDI|nr:Oidioi.mRNA.OKI2018_I69.YSR.g17205.t1.cds [Oikopleura dioica]